MKKIIIWLVVIVGILITEFVVYKASTGDFMNRMSRKGIELKAHDYDVVTSLHGGHTETFKVVNGKITSEPEKGYYLFWATVKGDKKYIQVPIMCSLIKQTD